MRWWMRLAQGEPVTRERPETGAEGGAAEGGTPGATEAEGAAGAAAQDATGGAAAEAGAAAAGAGAAQAQAEAQSGADKAQAEGATGEAGSEGRKGDLGKALRAERQQRQAASAEVSRLRAQLEKLARVEPPKLAFDGKDEDLLDGAQMRRMLEAQQASLMQSFESRLQARDRVDGLLREVDSYEIYGDDAVGGLARDALEARLREATSLEDATRVIAAVAKEASALAVDRGNRAAARGAQGARTLRQTTGSETAQQIKLEAPPTSFDEASSQARGLVSGIAKLVRAKVGI